jgi:quercetin dioxygenase-like cupin family protein
MKNLIKNSMLLLASIVAISVSVAYAENAVTADTDHYNVVLENDKVRVVRITYGAGEKSVMHEHGDGVVVFLTDSSTKMTLADGTSEDTVGKAGDVQWAPAQEHLPENTGEAMEAFYIELKN